MTEDAWTRRYRIERLPGDGGTAGWRVATLVTHGTRAFLRRCGTESLRRSRDTDSGVLRGDSPCSCSIEQGVRVVCRPFEVSRDGSRFLMVLRSTQGGEERSDIVLVQNFSEELRFAARR